MQTLFDTQTYQSLVARIDSLRPDSARQWGKMSASQMLEHAARVPAMATGAEPANHLLIGKLISWTVRGRFLGPAPFTKNAPTGPAFVVKDSPDFEAAKTKMKAVLKTLHEQGERGCDGNIHAFFGPLKGSEWGVTQFKHLDHHLRQFNA